MAEQTNRNAAVFSIVLGQFETALLDAGLCLCLGLSVVFKFSQSCVRVELPEEGFIERYEALEGMCADDGLDSTDAGMRKGFFDEAH